MRFSLTLLFVAGALSCSNDTRTSEVHAKGAASGSLTTMTVDAMSTTTDAPTTTDGPSTTTTWPIPTPDPAPTDCGLFYDLSLVDGEGFVPESCYAECPAETSTDTTAPEGALALADTKPWCKLPPNPGKLCMGYIMWEDVVSGTKKCDPKQTAEQIADKIWECYTTGKKCEVCEGDFTEIATALTNKYIKCLVARPDVKDGGMCLGEDIDLSKLEEGKCASVGVSGTRTYKDGTTGTFLHAVMVCKESGKLVVYDSNDPAAGGIPCTFKDGVLTWTANYNKPPKPVGAATQTGTVKDARSIIQCLNKSLTK